MVEKQNIDKEEERVIQRCTKIVRFPERVRVVCVCMYVCVCVTLDRYGYRLFTVVAWSDKSTEPEFSLSFTRHATRTRILVYSLFSPIPFHLRDDLPFLLYLRVFIPSCLIRELDSNRLVTRAASVCIVP